MSDPPTRVADRQPRVLVPGWRTVWRTSGSRLLEDIAGDGPGTDHAMGAPAKMDNELNRHLVWLSLPADEQAWAEHCPRPRDWDEGGDR